MAKGIVKGVTAGQQSGSTIVGTTTSTGGGPTVGPVTTSQGSSNPPGQIMTGTIQDSTNAQLIVNFAQAYGAALGLDTNVKVNYVTVTVGGQVIANSVRLLQRGEIMSINDDDTTGTLLDKATGNTIPFAQTYANEMGLTGPTVSGGKGTMVHFETIVDPNTAQLTAVALEIIGG
ncbi:MAG TPA: hypothetical protein VK806_07660 [Bacteroidia bacterium]|jgi:hypothetical protein|nr:hypothetical protein [Bacteroidia bacterium]